MTPPRPNQTGPMSLTLFIGGLVLILLTCFTLPSQHLRLAHGAILLRRADHPILFWAWEIFCIIVGTTFILLSVRQARLFIRSQRDLERKAVDDFRRQKGLPAQNNDHHDPANDL